MGGVDESEGSALHNEWPGEGEGETLIAREGAGAERIPEQFALHCVGKDSMSNDAGGVGCPTVDDPRTGTMGVVVVCGTHEVS